MQKGDNTGALIQKVVFQDLCFFFSQLQQLRTIKNS